MGDPVKVTVRGLPPQSKNPRYGPVDEIVTINYKHGFRKNFDRFTTK